MDINLLLTLLVLAAEIAVIIFCRYKLKQPVDPLKPRLMPYRAIIVIAAVAVMVTVAHIISLLTGQQLMPKRSGKIR